jgi:hypothetical protein
VVNAILAGQLAAFDFIALLLAALERLDSGLVFLETFAADQLLAVEGGHAASIKMTLWRLDFG